MKLRKVDFFSTQLFRYIVNGVISTIIHYGALVLFIEFLNVLSRGGANFFASIVGIFVSFLGSRFFVFRSTEEGILFQALKFSGLYGVVAFGHGFFLYLLSDLYSVDYRIAFIAALFFQVILTFFGGKRLVFNS
ncbi:MAG: GtrA family protein [Cellvibrionaceae bacterium]